MTRRSGRVVAKILFLLLWLGQPAPSLAQSVADSNRVVSVVEDFSGNLVLLNTSQHVPISAPVIHYLPGPDVGTILVADFAGLVWKEPSRTITPAQKGIFSVRIGQFQSNPPILRIAVSTNQPQLLKNLAFRSSPGVLTVKWGTAVENTTRRALVPAAAAPPVVPPVTNAPPHRGKGEQPISATAMAKTGRSTERMPAVARLPGTDSSMPPTAPLPGASEMLPATAPDRGHASPPTQSDTASRQAVSEAPTGPTEAKRTSGWRGAFRRLFGTAEPESPDNDVQANDAGVPTTDKQERGAGTPSAQHGPRKQPAETASPSATATGRSDEPINKTAGARGTDRAKAEAAAQRKTADATKRRTSELSEKSKDFSSGALPRLSVSGAGPVRIEIESQSPFSYRAFRLHEPERYVVDIPALPDLANPELPPPESGQILKGLRVGHPENEPGTSRVVLDLPGTEIDVKETIDDRKRLLTLTVDKVSPFTQAVKLAPATTVVVVDAGHGGNDPGAQRGDIQEKEITLEITEKVKRILERGGVKVVMTRAEDSAVSLEERVNLTNSTHPDAFLSVHINSLETNSSIHGIETYYQTDQSRPFAQLIHEKLVGKLEAPDRFVRKARFYVINHTAVPAVLAEVGFISNKEERSKLISSDYQNQVANALAEGVILYLSKRTELAGAGANKDQAGTTGASNQSVNTAGQNAKSLAQAAKSSSHGAK